MNRRPTIPAEIIDGQAVAQKVRAEVAEAVAALPPGARKPGLTVVLVGEDPASQVYVKSKGIATRKAGMVSGEHRLPADTSQADLLALIRQLNADPTVDGILVQLPAPKHIDPNAILETLDPRKDVDGLTAVNVGKLAMGKAALVACTPKGCMKLIEGVVPSTRGLNAVVVGRSALVGKPIAQLLLAADCTVTMAHSKTRDLAAVCRSADVLVAAVGVPEMIKGDFVKPGAVVIDVGINRVERGGESRLVGDVAFDEAKDVAGFITPVPGGVGPMTIACLLENTLIAYREREGLR